MNALTYLLAGKTQYNLHSPFVFGLYTEVLLPRVSPSFLQTCGLSLRDRRNAAFMYKLADHYGLKKILVRKKPNVSGVFEWAEEKLPRLLGTEAGVSENDCKSPFCASLMICDAESFLSMKKENSELFSHGTVVVVPDIHVFSASERLWETITNDTSNILTIDVYTMGMVFFREELSVQRFLLRV